MFHDAPRYPVSVRKEILKQLRGFIAETPKKGMQYNNAVLLEKVVNAGIKTSAGATPDLSWLGNMLQVIKKQKKKKGLKISKALRTRSMPVVHSIVSQPKIKVIASTKALEGDDTLNLIKAVAYGNFNDSMKLSLMKKILPQ